MIKDLGKGITHKIPDPKPAPVIIKPGDKVRCTRAYSDPRVLEMGKEYKVAVVVGYGQDHRGSCHGVVLTTGYPYVWDLDRFVKV